MTAPVEHQPKVDDGSRTARPATKRPKRTRHEVETLDYLSAAARFIRAAGIRVGQGDEAELQSLLNLHVVLDEATQAAVDGQLAIGKTWKDIAAATGKSTQAAHKRWGRKTEGSPS